jgi:hypothetical protein
VMRHPRPFIPLIRDEEGEIYQGNLLIMPGKGLQDPADELEQKEDEMEVLQQLVTAVRALPPRQQYATICSLKDRFENLITLISVFKDIGVDIEKMHWPADLKDVQRLRASLSFSRNKLRSVFKK